MKCPVCKYDNADGVTHCGMCYEVFNRSAADAFLRNAQKERAARERLASRESPSSDQKLTELLSEAEQLAKAVDWGAMKQSARTAVAAHRRLLAGIAIGLVAITAIMILRSPSVRFAAYGTHLGYAIATKAPSRYLIGYQSDMRFWSERAGRLDTPIEQTHLEDFATADVTTKRTGAKGESAAVGTVKEWVQMHGTDHTASATIPRSHPSIGPMTVRLNANGAVVARDYSVSPRMGKAMTFLFPSLPTASLRKDMRWDEPVQWVDSVGDFKIFWEGTRHWRIVGPSDLPDDPSMKLSYTTSLRPQIWAGPSWIGSQLRRARFAGNGGTGDARFDAGEGRLVAHSYRYEGTFVIPVSDLGDIPDELRVGRPVRGPGELMLNLSHKTDLRLQ